MGNGTLLAAAEADFDILTTTDQNMRYQQNLRGRRLAILVLPTTNWTKIRNYQSQVRDTVNTMRHGAYVELVFP